MATRRHLMIGAGAGLAAGLFARTGGIAAAGPRAPEPLRRAVDRVIPPLMAAHRIPGMAVAIAAGGSSHVFPYGLDAPRDARPVDDRTLFEIGSLSKTFTGTLGALVAADGRLSLADPASRDFSPLAGTAFDRISLLDLATYTAGGLPLQFPDAVRNEADLPAFFRNWKPAFPPGATRLYSNPSLGLFGSLAARRAGAGFDDLMSRTLLPKLGLSDTFLTVPAEAAARYAWGTAPDDRPVRVAPGPLAAEAYGIKTTAGDLICFVQLAMDPSSLEPSLRAAILAAQTGYVRFGPALQGLGWEIYDGPAILDALLLGHAPAMTLEPQPVTRLDPPVAPRPGRWVDKTGSTQGFGAYAAFLPESGIGIAMLANRAFPVPERVKAAWTILAALP